MCELSRLAGLHMKGELTPLRNWSTLGGAVPPEPSRPQTSKHQKPVVNTEPDLELSMQTLCIYKKAFSSLALSRDLEFSL